MGTVLNSFFHCLHRFARLEKYVLSRRILLRSTIDAHDKIIPIKTSVSLFNPPNVPSSRILHLISSLSRKSKEIVGKNAIFFLEKIQEDCDNEEISEKDCMKERNEKKKWFVRYEYEYVV